ncbi:cyclin-dependent kinases regulatory subunit [Plakobranchus ocellatus]|uniref:Cyclin-dependent kinases regulatory subunit n=1 Tax=Plakobranchus ocellatus TaxID=259542 RepID=A0AAV3YBD9_9GAST|nr:cyclin-dependent kinases regulatory subunit [Plakobranchus ocellatus]
MRGIEEGNAEVRNKKISKEDMAALQKQIFYSDKYNDDEYEYRHVMLPKEIAKLVPKRLMSEQEWRGIGVQQSQGWIHFMRHDPEPHILLFRRKLPGSMLTS